MKKESKTNKENKSTYGKTKNLFVMHLHVVTKLLYFGSRLSTPKTSFEVRLLLR